MQLHLKPQIMRIGLISDTHGHLEKSVFAYFESCDEIWHAGDIGSMALLQELEAFRPTVAVFGNIDDMEMRNTCPEDQILERDGAIILITHIAGSPPRYNPRVKKLITMYRPSLLVCGHSHILKVAPDPVHQLLYMNPGAAGVHGFHRIKTLLRFDIQEGKVLNLEVVELGLRGKIG